MKIHLLWSTVRPLVFLNTYTIWKNRMKNSNDLFTYVAVETQEDADIITFNIKEKENFKIFIHSSKKRGVCESCYVLSSQLEGNKDDIVIFGSDDFVAPLHFDTYLKEKFKGREGALLVNDGVQSIDFSSHMDPIFSIPIMNFGTLEKLNKIIYHPAYQHLCSDSELFLNLKELGLIIDERLKDRNIIFEHKHWSNHKRQPDINDQSYYSNFENDKKTWEVRKKLTLNERLKVQL